MFCIQHTAKVTYRRIRILFIGGTRDWNQFYDNRIYRKSIRIDFKIDYRIKLNLLIVLENLMTVHF